ncbi:MAG: TVP38/TMEM64 family protein [Sarcina sp.]
MVDKIAIKKYIKWGSIIFIMLIICIPIVLNFDKIVEFASNPTEIKNWVLSYGSASAIVFVILQVLQIIIFFIPGEVVQFAGGYIFGPYLSFLLCIIGIVLGSGITFMISRKFGKPFVEKIVHKDSLWIIKKIEDTKHHREETHPHKKRKKHPKTVIFILYMIPGIPKDILGYISGIADISLKEFLLVSTIARMPALFVSCFFGTKLDFIKGQFRRENIIPIIVIGVLIVIVIGVVYFIGRKFVNKLKEDVEV